MKTETTLREKQSTRIIVKKCHMCGHIIESSQEVQKCHQCKKSFLPVNYFAKVHSKNQSEFEQLFAESHDIDENDLIKGLTVLW